MQTGRLGLALLMVALPAAAPLDAARGEQDKARPKVDQAQVDAAIKKGVASLKIADSHAGNGVDDSDELILWTYVHAGVPETDPAFQALFRKMMAARLERTYKVSLQAMILEELHRVKYQGRIAQCAQFLVDNQHEGGTWSYGEHSPFADEVPVATETARKDVATGASRAGKVLDFEPEAEGGRREKPKVVRKIPVQQRRATAPSGDNSNTQYAALGLRACHDAGIVLPEKVLKLGQKHWRDTVRTEERKGATGGGGGWCYCLDHPPYGSMTAGAVGSLVIYDFLLGEDWRRDKAAQKGMEWLERNFTVTENPGTPEHDAGKIGFMHYYYLYALERAGTLAATEKFGSREWYPEGARFLLNAQRLDGSWLATNTTYLSPTWDTCFAILFLRRATRPLVDVASVDRFHRK